VKLTSGDLTADTASACLLMTRAKFLLPSTVEPRQTPVTAAVHVMQTLESAPAREPATLSLDCALATLAPVVEVASKERAAKTATMQNVKPTATATMECVTASQASVCARPSKTLLTSKLGLDATTVKCAWSLCARTSTWQTGPVQWTSGDGPPARRVSCLLVSRETVWEMLCTTLHMECASSLLRAPGLPQLASQPTSAIMRTGGRSLTAREASSVAADTSCQGCSEATATHFTALRWPSAVVQRGLSGTCANGLSTQKTLQLKKPLLRVHTSLQDSSETRPTPLTASHGSVPANHTSTVQIIVKWPQGFKQTTCTDLTPNGRYHYCTHDRF